MHVHDMLLFEPRWFHQKDRRCDGLRPAQEEAARREERSNELTQTEVVLHIFRHCIAGYVGRMQQHRRHTQYPLH
jgi:hypothetical protein